MGLLLIQRILDGITVLKDGETFSDLWLVLDAEYHAEYHVRMYQEASANSKLQGSFGKKKVQEYGQ